MDGLPFRFRSRSVDHQPVSVKLRCSRLRHMTRWGLAIPPRFDVGGKEQGVWPGQGP